MKRRTTRRLTLALAAAALLAACATPYSLVEPKRRTVGGVISVQPGMPWNKLDSPNVAGRIEVWTLDGTVLNTLVFFTGVRDGEPLMVRDNVKPGREEKPPVFRASMNPLEVQELLEATITRLFRTTIAEGRSLHAETVAEGRGFRFETRMVGRDEVERWGVFVGTIRNGRLYGAWFQGARLNYYARYLPEFDRMVGSAKLVGEAAK